MEREKFVGNFNQAKNLIEKQMKIGMVIRNRKDHKQEKKRKVIAIKDASKTEKKTEPVKAVQFGAFPEDLHDMSTNYDNDPFSGPHSQSVMVD
jgi:hypothetical protein